MGSTKPLQISALQFADLGVVINISRFYFLAVLLESPVEFWSFLCQIQSEVAPDHSGLRWYTQKRVIREAEELFAQEHILGWWKR